MEVNIKTLKFNADQKLLDFVNKKVEKLERFDDLESVDVSLSLMERPDNKNVKIQARSSAGVQIIERNAKTFEDAVNECVDAMKEKLVRSKERHHEM